MGTQLNNYKHYLNILFENIKNITSIIHFLSNSKIQIILI